ncbi:MAG: branched-chain amino acid transaminase [Calditrichia bacterium]
MLSQEHFPGAKKFWHMGKLYPWETFNIHVMTHALHYGSSVFEGIRAYHTSRGPAVFRLQEHIDRFFISAEVMNMKVPYSKEEIIDTIKLVMKENQLKAAYIRPNLFNSYGNLGLVPKASPPELTIACWAWGAYLGEEALEKGVHVLILHYRRVHTSQVDMRAKIGGIYSQSNIAGTYARRMGYDEGIFLNIEGRIAEGPGENVLLVKNNTVKTNDKSESILEGITRTTILKLAQDQGYNVEIGPITLEEFFQADEVFFTGTAAEVTPITRVTDGRDKEKPKDEWKVHVFGNGTPGPITRQLAAKYKEVVQGKDPHYEEWLTYVYDSPEEAQANLKSL